MSLSYIQFVKPIAVPKVGSIDRWSRDIDAKRCPAEERGDFIILSPASAGGTIRVPIANVAYILDDTDAASPAKGKAKVSV